MSEPLHRIADAVADITESDAVAALTALGLQKDRRQPAKKTLRTPLPPLGPPSDVSSDVEWV
ncbi:hypothetical protein [Streptomyces sp. NPDC058985]|uniref:hypothetical protein n=1 Tax=Streptomyces sp. NPDC058985 TaxID=3346684 RepID=UPI00367C7923